MEHFQWLRPLWLLAIIPALLLTVLLWSTRSSGANWRRAIAPELLDHLLDQQRERRVRWPWWLVFAGWLLGCFALAGPTWEKLPQPVLQNRDAVVVVLDLSLSMIAADVQPSRLQRARFKILDLLKERREGLTGLVAYSGDAHIVTPLTDDTDTIANLVPALAPDMMPIYGSDVVGGVTQALQLLQSSGVTRGRVLLLTDDIEDADVGALVDAIGKTRHTLAIIGIGTTQGAPIPINGAGTNGGFLKEPNGSIAVPRLHRERLQKLAAQSGGIYRDLSADDSDLRSLLPDNAPQDSELRATEREFDQWRERGPWLVLLVLPFAALAFRRGWLLVLLATLMITTPDAKAAATDPAAAGPATNPASTPTQTDALLQRGSQLWRNLWSTPDQQASKRLEQGDTQGAAEQFTDPAWRASAQYRAGDYEKAAKNFETLLGPDGKSTADADYNRGNALARAGQLQQSMAAYDAALKKNPALEDAKANRKLVEDLLKEQQKTEPDSKPGDNKDQQSQQNADADNQQKNSGAQQSDQDSQSQNSQPHDPQQQSQPKNSQNADAQNDSNKKDQASQTDEQKKSQDAMNENQQQTRDSQKKAAEQAAQTSKPEPTLQDDSKQKGQQAVGEAKELTPEQQRQQQVMEQWLRQIPDDPSGLLRRKFDYEHRERMQPAENGNRPLY